MDTKDRTNPRKIYTQKQFDKEYRLPPKKKISIQQNLNQKRKKYFTFSKACIMDKFLGFIPIISVIKNYNLREDIAGDIIAGISVGIMHIPLALAFAMLASVLPVYGLYSSFFQATLYAIFGTSHHVAPGTMAVISIMVSNVVDRETDIHYPDTETSKINSSYLDTNDTLLYDNEKENFKIGIAMTLGMLVGIIQISMGIVRLGFATAYLSPPFIGGFTTGAVVHASTSQIINVLGIKVTKYKGIFNMPKTYIDLIQKIPEVNLASFIIGALTFLSIFLVKECINQRFRSKLRVPIPIEVIVVFLVILITHFTHLDEIYDVTIVGDIEQGFPTPVIPPMGNAGNIVVDSLVIAIVSFTLSVALANIFTQRYNYTIDTNQEFLAYGISHFVSSFFWSYPGCGGPAKTCVLESAGGKSQVANLIAGLVILLVILVAGPLFYSLPTSCLSALVIACFTRIYMQFLELKPYWNANKYDFLIWIITFCAVCLTDIDIGCIIGIAFSFFSVVIRTQFPKTYPLGEVNNLEIFRNAKTYRIQGATTVKIVRFESPLYFANSELLKTVMYKIIPPHVQEGFSIKGKDYLFDVIEINDSTVDENVHLCEVETETSNGNEGTSDINASHVSDEETCSLHSTNFEGNDTTKILINNHAPVVNCSDVIMTSARNYIRAETNIADSVSCSTEHLETENVGIIILDCTAVSFIDSTGVKCLAVLHDQYAQAGVQFFIAGCTEAVHDALVNSEPFNQHVTYDCIYVTVNDAYSAAMKMCNG